MAHQDYVSRSRSPKKKSNPYKSKEQEVAPALSTKFKLLTAITLLAISAFAYLLWSIKDNQPSVEPIKQINPPTTAKWW